MENIICKLCHAGFYVLQSFSIFLLVAIAADRFYAVTQPLKRTPTDKKNNCNIVVDTVRAYSYHGLWFGGNMENIICKLCHAGFYVLQSFSIFLLVAIAADRFYAVTRPLKRTPTDKKNNCNIVDVFAHREGEVEKESYFCHLGKPPEFNKWTEFNVTSLTVGVFSPLTSVHMIKICQTMVPSGTRRRSYEIARKVTFIIYVATNFL